MAWYNPSTWSVVDQIQNGVNGSHQTSSGAWVPGTYAPAPGATFNQPQQVTSVLGAQGINPFVVNNGNTPPPNNGGTPIGNAGGVGNPQQTIDPQALAYYDNQIGRINSQLGNLDPQLDVGRQNLLNSYNDQLSQLGLDESRNSRDYNSNRINTIQQQENAKRGIDSGVRQNTNALLRLLGRSNSGNSSAAQTLAPFAAARLGSQQRSEVQDKYNRNLQTLDTNWQDYNQNLGIAKSDLAKQRDERQNTLVQGINQTRANLLETLAGLTTQRGQAAGKNYQDAYAGAQPYASQIESILGRVAELSRQGQNPALQANPVAYKAPSLSDYSYGKNRGAQADAPVYQDQITPYSLLFNDERKKANGLA